MPNHIPSDQLPDGPLPAEMAPDRTEAIIRASWGHHTPDVIMYTYPDDSALLIDPVDEGKEYWPNKEAALQKKDRITDAPLLTKAELPIS